MRMKIAVLGLVLALTTPAQAQTGHAFAKHGTPVANVGRMINPTTKSDSIFSAGVLNVSPDTIVAGLNHEYSWLHLENRADAAAYLKGLAVTPCVVGKTRLARVVNGHIDYRGWERDIYTALPDGSGPEMCLTDIAHGQQILSLWCFNFTPELKVPLVPVAVVEAPKKAEAPVAVTPTPAPVQTLILRIVESPRPEPKPKPVPIEIAKQSYWGRNWGKYTAGTIAVAVAGYFICKNNCRSQNFTNNNTNINTNR